MRSLVDEFTIFILRGNVLDLAVAVVFSAALGTIITSLVENNITPVIAAIGGQPNLSALTFTINTSEFHYGAFITSLIITLVVFFLIIKPVDALMVRVASPAAEAEPAICPGCFCVLSPDANRHQNCTTWLRGQFAPVS